MNTFKDKALRSPQALGLTLVTIAALAFAAFWLPSHLADHPTAPTPTTHPAVQADPFEAAALTFAQAWSQEKPGQSHEQWQVALRPLCVQDLADALGLTDPAELPGVPPTGKVTERYRAGDSGQYAVEMAAGAPADLKIVLVTVVQEGDRPLVTSVDQDLGD